MARLTGSLLVDGNVIAESLTGSVQGTATTASYIAGANVDGNVANATNVYITNYPGYDGDQRIAFVGGVNQYNSVRADTEFNFNPGQNKLSVPNVNATTLTGSLDWNQLDNVPAGIISSSDGIVPDGTVSSSAQTIANLPEGTISSSAQVEATLSNNSVNFGTGTVTADDMVVANALTHEGDTDTKVSFSSNEVKLEANGKDMLKVFRHTDGRMRTVINDGGESSYFRLENSATDKLIYTAPTTVGVGIGGDYGVDALTVHGNVKIDNGILRLKEDGGGALSENILIGSSVVYDIDDGNEWQSSFASNVIIGNDAGFEINNQSAQNTLIGNGGIGYNDGADAGDWDGNVALGFSAMKYSTNPDYVTAIGYGAHSRGGDYGVSIGYLAGSNSDTGAYNTSIGALAGRNISTSAAQHNIFLGYKAGPQTSDSDELRSADAQLYIAYEDGSDTALVRGDLRRRNFRLNVLDDYQFLGRIGNPGFYVSGSTYLDHQGEGLALEVTGSTKLSGSVEVVGNIEATELTGSLDWDNLDNVPSGLMSSSDVNDATITLSAGTGLSGGGNFTTNQSGNETITFNVGTAPQADLVKINSHNGNDTGFMAFMTGSGTHRSVNISSAFIYTPTLSNEGATDGTLQAEDVYFDVRSLGTANNTKIRVGNFTGNLSSEFSYTGNLLHSASEFYIGEGGGYVWNKLLHDNEGVISSSAQVNLSEAAGSVTTAATASYVSGSNVDGEVYEAERARRIEVGSYGSYSNLTDIPFITGDYGSNIKRISSDGVLRWHAGQDALWVPNISASNAITSSYLHVKDNAFIQGRLNLQHDRFGAGTYSVLIGEDSGETGFESSNINFTENTMIGTGAGRYVAANSNLNTFVGFNTARTYDGAARSVMNTAFGYNAMYNLGSGSSVTHQGNTAIGARALNHPGGSNTGLGYHALHTDALIGNDNIGIGAYAGSQLEGGSGNIYIGSFSGPSSDTNENYKLYINSGSGTPLIGGDFSARTVTIDGGITATSITGSFSVDYYDIDNIPVSTSNPITPVLHIPNGSVDRGLVAIGNGVLTNAISASNLPFGSVVIGKDAGAGLNAGLLGSDNIVIGRQAMENYGNQIDNCLNLSIVVGAYAGFNSSGTENVTLGGQSYTSGSGNNNTILGTWAANGYGFTGDSNTIIGHQAGGNSAAGVGIKGDSNKNTIVGASATVRQGSCNVLIGYGAGSDTDFSNKLYIENGGSTPLIEGDFSTNHIKINDVLELNQSDPLPSGGVGQLAVSASNLYFHNGSSWSQIN